MTTELARQLGEPASDLVVRRVGVGPTPPFGTGRPEVELHRDFALRLLQLRPRDVAAMSNPSSGAALLCGCRGAPATDSELEASIKRPAARHRRQIRVIDFNPMRVWAERQRPLVRDALVFAYQEAADGAAPTRATSESQELQTCST